MRATGRLCALFCALLALPAIPAQAKITPLPRPAGITGKPAAIHAGSLIAPVARPSAPAIVKPVRPRIVSRRSATVRRPARAPRRRGFVPASSRGGRERNSPVRSAGGRGASIATAAAIVPTPLGIVGAGEALPTDSHAWAAWKVAALTLLAAAEAFVLVRLVRDSRFARSREV